MNISIGFANVNSVTGEPQRTKRSEGNRHERTEPVKVYSTEAKAAAYTLPGFEVKEVFVEF